MHGKLYHYLKDKKEIFHKIKKKIQQKIKKKQILNGFFIIVFWTFPITKIFDVVLRNTFVLMNICVLICWRLFNELLRRKQKLIWSYVCCSSCLFHNLLKGLKMKNSWNKKESCLCWIFQFSISPVIINNFKLITFKQYWFSHT